jgi:1,4-dihydroxy-2-naphthoyl-CoA hydrolase
MAQREPSPFTRLLGIKIIDWTAERTESELHVRDDLCNRRGVMHGGAVMAWGDTLGGMTASAALTDSQTTATIESKTNFFAPIPKGETARAVCVPLHSGRTTIVLQTNITRSDGKLAAIVTQTQIVLPAKPAPG